MNQAVGLYLKYFFSSSSSSRKAALEILDGEEPLTENQDQHLQLDKSERELDNPLQEHTNELIEIGLGLNYKNKKNKKTIFKIQQTSYSNVGLAWKVWDSSIIFSRWLWANQHILVQKKVLEVGSGCGLVGMVTSMFCEKITLTDYTQQILDNIQHNINLNQTLINKNNITLSLLDWCTFSPTNLPQGIESKYDVIIGTDVVFHLALAKLLISVIAALLDENGVIYLVNPKNRWGIEEFIEEIEKSGFNVKKIEINENLFKDFGKKSSWLMIECRWQRTINLTTTSTTSTTSQINQDPLKRNLVSDSDSEKDGFGEIFFNENDSDSEEYHLKHTNKQIKKSNS
eukprot:TRINITY_DN435_c0_g1_i1.p1 TRINITY_DN435_c0_g1~~TRINITY_DN435_c0_g1_i1.p1  ORF type:complete len:343 (+),score=143.25 TRINITY_DN435_c0_g1_i1:89-1117(+)